MSENKDVLVVASKLKKYIKESAGMNTSASIMGILSEKIREYVNGAVERARNDGRKTVMDRDFE